MLTNDTLCNNNVYLVDLFMFKHLSGHIKDWGNLIQHLSVFFLLQN